MTIVAGDIILSQPPSCCKVNLKNTFNETFPRNQTAAALECLNCGGFQRNSEDTRSKRAGVDSKEIRKISIAKRLIDASYKRSIPQGTWRHLQIVEPVKDVLDQVSERDLGDFGTISYYPIC